MPIPLVTRILIADDHAIVRSGLKKVLDAKPDLEVRLGVQHLLQAGADDGVVVSDQDAGDERDRHQLTPSAGTACAVGTSRRTSTPPSGPSLIASAPPTRTARSRMLRRPPCSTGMSAKPRPSSLTRRTTLSWPRSRAMATRVAAACLATFVRHSCAIR